MSDRDAIAVLAVVRRAVDAAPGNKRDLETAMSIGHGRLEEILNGEPELRVRHLVGLARLLKVRPSDFLRLAYGSDEAAAPRYLEDWIGDPQPLHARRKPDTFTPKQEERVRDLIREELARAKA